MTPSRGWSSHSLQHGVILFSNPWPYHRIPDFSLFSGEDSGNFHGCLEALRFRPSRCCYPPRRAPQHPLQQDLPPPFSWSVPGPALARVWLRGHRQQQAAAVVPFRGRPIQPRAATPRATTASWCISHLRRSRPNHFPPPQEVPHQSFHGGHTL